MSNSANLPAPFLGIKQDTPVAAIESPYCENLLNFNTTDIGVSLRNGDSTWSSTKNVAPSTTDTFVGFVKYGNTKLFYAADQNAANVRYFDITSSGTPSVAHTSTTLASPSEIFTMYFGNRVFIFGDNVAAGDYFDGSSWGAWGFTFSTITPVGACGYKNRAYFMGWNSTIFSYGGIDAVTGATTEKDLSGVILEKSTLSTIAPVTVANAGQTLQLLAFVFFSGEVLFYSGSYPDSTTWTLEGRGKIGKPLNYNSSIDFQGDSLIMTRIGVVSLRDVFLSGGQNAITQTISRAIDPTWIELIAATISGSIFYDSASGRISYTRADWWQAQNRLIIGFPTLIDSSNNVVSGAFYFIYDTLRQAWYLHESAGVDALLGLVQFRDFIFICGNYSGDATHDLIIKQKEGATDFQDTDSGSVKASYSYEMLSAPIPFPKTAVYEATQIEPILESDLYAETNYNFVVDFGRQTSGNQPTDALTTSVAKPAVNVGMQNITYVQVKMSGTTAASKSVGLDLYSFNVWYNAGATGSR